MKQYAFGVDLGGTTVKMGFFKTDGTLIEKWEIPTRTEENGKYILEDISKSIISKMSEKKIECSEVEGIGMGVPGAVLNDRYVNPCVNLSQWGGFDVADKMSELCGIPVKIVNDANAAALGEMGQGGGKGHKNVVFVTLGTGVGGGIIVNGKILAGVHGAGGEIGHIKVVDKDGRICGCGKKGCLEQYASATGIVKSAIELLNETEKVTKLRDYETLTCKDIFDCASAEDKEALKLVDEMSNMLGKALAAISCICDPEVIVIGGGVSKAGSILLEAVKKHFVEYAFPAAEKTEFAIAELGNDAGIYGGVQMILS